MDALAPEEIDDEVEVAFDEEYNPEREEQLKNQLANQKGSLSPYWARKLPFQWSSVESFNKNAGKYWHEFYKNNGNRFFKDRHYLDIVFDEMNEMETRGVDAVVCSLTGRVRKSLCWKWAAALETPSSLCVPSTPICVSTVATLPSRRLTLFR